VGSQDGFSAAVGDRLEGELKAQIGLVNSSQYISANRVQEALQNATYYSGSGQVDAVTWNSCGNVLARSGKFSRSLFYYNKSIESNR